MRSMPSSRRRRRPCFDPKRQAPLGESRRDVAASVAGRSLRLAALGGVCGLIVAFGLAQAMRSILCRVGPSDPLTYFGVVVTAVAALAS